MPDPKEDHAAPRSHSAARRFVFFLRKFWWIPLLTVVLGLGTAGYYIYYRMPPNFISGASMWETEKMKLPEGAEFTEDLQNYLGTQMELLRSGAMDQRVVARLQAANKDAVPLGKDGRPMKVKITVNQAPRSTIFTVQAVSANPAYSQSYLDALLNEYLEYKKNVRKTVSGGTLASITEQVERMERDLKDQQADLTSFERTNNLAILQEEGTVAGGYLAKLQTDLSDLKIQSQLLDATAAQPDLAASGTTNALSDSAFSMSSSTMPASSDHFTPFQEIELLKSDREKLSRNLRPKHPKIVKLDAQIQRDEKIIEIYRHDYAEQLAASKQKTREQRAVSRQSIKMKMENVEASIKEWEAKVVEANNRIAEAEHLKLTVSRTQSVYDRLKMMVQNVDISRNIDQETLTVLSPASPSIRSYADEISLLEQAGIGGLVLGLGLILVIGKRDDRITSLADASEKFGDIIVGQVPDMPAIRGATRMPLLELEDERDMYAESYRSLRSAIFFMARNGERPKILLVTSALPNEGKSTIAANLARTLALGGSRVLLVDADLRMGYLHDLLGMRLEPGLADLVDRPDDLETIIQSDSLPNFAFLSRGKRVPNPGDILFSSKLDQVFARLRERFDYVIIDSSPIFASDDASSLAPKADSTLFVVRSRFSQAGAVKEALELLNRRQARVLGLVFNRADVSTRSYYYYKSPEYYRPKKT
jgi:capsular exopolysaccharide synthesis family protein